MIYNSLCGKCFNILEYTVKVFEATGLTPNAICSWQVEQQKKALEIRNKYLKPCVGIGIIDDDGSEIYLCKDCLTFLLGNFDDRNSS